MSPVHYHVCNSVISIGNGFFNVNHVDIIGNHPVSNLSGLCDGTGLCKRERIVALNDISSAHMGFGDFTCHAIFKHICFQFFNTADFQINACNKYLRIIRLFETNHGFRYIFGCNSDCIIKSIGMISFLERKIAIINFYAIICHFNHHSISPYNLSQTTSFR